MSTSGSARKSSWPTVAHTERATATPVGKRVGIENSRIKQGPLVAPGGYLARMVMPIHRAAVHGVMANDILGHYGMRDLLEGKNAYGHAVPSDLLRDTF